MAISITRTPKDVSLTGSPILFEAISTLYGEQTLLKINIRIERLVGSQPVLVATKQKSPNTNGVCQFDVSEPLKSKINSSTSYPNSNYAVVQHNNNAIYRIAVWESYYNAGQIVNTDETYSDWFVAIKGGVSDQTLAQFNDFNTSFYEEWLQAGKFLTHMPRTIDVAPSGHPIHLSFLCLSGMGTTLYLTFQTKYNNAWTTPVKAPYPAQEGKIFEFNAGTDIVKPSSNTEAYRVWIQNENGEAVSETFTFNIDRQTYQRNTFFLFQNSLNGYDTLWCKGLQTESSKFAKEVVQRTRATDITGSDPTRVVKRSTFSTEKTINTGIVKQADIFAWLREFFMSERVYITDANYAYNVIIESDNYNGDSDFRQPRSISFVYTSAYINQYYGIKLFDINSEIVGGDFNFDFNDDYNTGDGSGDNTTPPLDTILDTEYRCVVDGNGTNTGEQERRYVLADGNGGTYYGEWVNIGTNLLACPLPPTSVSLEVVEETSTYVAFRAVLDRSVANENYSVQLNRAYSPPPWGPYEDDPGSIAACPNLVVIQEGSGQSPTVKIYKDNILLEASLYITIDELTPAWLAIAGDGFYVTGTQD